MDQLLLLTIIAEEELAGPLWKRAHRTWGQRLYGFRRIRKDSSGCENPEGENIKIETIVSGRKL